MPTQLTTVQAARVLNISPRTLRQWIQDGYIKAQKLNPKSKSIYYISNEEVTRILKLRPQSLK